jgi:hypothetical protein
MIKTPRKPAPDRCKPQRDALEQLLAKIDDTASELGDPDLSPAERRRLEALLGRLNSRLPQVRRALRLCEAQASGAPAAAKKKKAAKTGKKPGKKKAAAKKG